MYNKDLILPYFLLRKPTLHHLLQVQNPHEAISYLHQFAYYIIVLISSVFCVFSVTFVLSPLPPRSLSSSSSFSLLFLLVLSPPPPCSLSLSQNAFGGSLIKRKLFRQRDSFCLKLKEERMSFFRLFVKKIKRSIFFYVLFCYFVE